MKSFENMFFLAGLPRTGSSLLTAILSENPDILTEGTSGLIDLMWENQKLFNENLTLKENIENTKKYNIKEILLKNIPHLYYLENKRNFVIDKNRN
jgi:sulfotransferase